MLPSMPALLPIPHTRIIKTTRDWVVFESTLEYKPRRWRWAWLVDPDQDTRILHAVAALEYAAKISAITSSLVGERDTPPLAVHNLFAVRESQGTLTAWLCQDDYGRPPAKRQPGSKFEFVSASTFIADGERESKRFHAAARNSLDIAAQVATGDRWTIEVRSVPEEHGVLIDDALASDDPLRMVPRVWNLGLQR